MVEVTPDTVDKASAWDAATATPRKVQRELESLRTENARLRRERDALREAVSEARSCLIDHLQHLKEPSSARIIRQIDATLASITEEQKNG